MQADLKDSLNFAADHVIAVQIIQDWSQCASPKQMIAVLTDNRGHTGCTQREDVEDTLDLDAVNAYSVSFYTLTITG